tara:strand:- start:2616 stop:3035 length:420 start_codon:yes stop_codon:yes gene_type:complete
MKKFSFLFSTTPYFGDLANLLFRVVVGLSLMTHGYSKLMRLVEGKVWGRTHLFFNEEVSFALITFAEFFAPLLIILGLGTRLFAIPVIYAFIIIVFDAHWDDPFTKMEKGLLFLISYIFIFMIGPGKISLDNLITKKFK